MQSTNIHETVSPRKTAELLSIRLDAVYSLIWAGKLTAQKSDGRWFVSRSAVEARIKAKIASGSKRHSCDRSVP